MFIHIVVLSMKKEIHLSHTTHTRTLITLSHHNSQLQNSEMHASISPLSTLYPRRSTLRRLCGLRREAFGFHSPSQFRNRGVGAIPAQPHSWRRRPVFSALAADNGSRAPASFDYDLVIIGAGVGGHGAALHAVEKVGTSIFFIW